MSAEHAENFYIDGQWINGGSSARLPVVDPALEQVFGHIAAGSPDDVDLAVGAARRAFETFSQSSVEERLSLLGRIHALIGQRAELFAQAIVTEMGAAIGFSRASQVPFAAEHVRV